MNKDDSGKFISAQGASPRVAGLCGELQEERVLFDLADPVVLAPLRADAMRMAASPTEKVAISVSISAMIIGGSSSCGSSSVVSG